MSTAYLVKCPRPRCHWFGELPAKPDPDAWREPADAAPTVAFECPRCRGEWRARIVCRTAQPILAEAAELEPSIDLGDGD